MPLAKSWYTLGEAASKCCLKTAIILNWVEQGVVRARQVDTRLMQVHIEDIESRLVRVTGI